MTFSNIKSALISFIALLLLTGSLFAGFKESELEKLSSLIMNKIISDNKNDSPAIREYLNGVVVGNNSGMKLIDKLALFLFNSNREGVKLHKALFLRDRKKDEFMLFLVFSDKEKEEYLLHLHYSFERRKKVCVLKNVYFSLVFGEKKEQVDNYFRYR